MSNSMQCENLPVGLQLDPIQLVWQLASLCFASISASAVVVVAAAAVEAASGASSVVVVASSRHSEQIQPAER